MQWAVLLLIGSCCAAQIGPTGAISGVVRDAATGVPVTEAQVSVTLAGGGTITSAVDARGQYTLDHVPAGTYRVHAESLLAKGDVSLGGPQKTVTLTAGQRLTAFDFRLPLPGAIRGRVLDENRKPVAGAAVYLIEKRYNQGELWYAADRGVFTDERGAYEFTGAPIGAALLLQTRNKLRRADATGATPADTFYPNVVSPDSATEIILSSGETREGIDIHRVASPTFCVSGQAEGADGAPRDLTIMDAFLKLRTPDMERAGETNPDGSFSLCGFHPGEYMIFADGKPSQKNDFPFFNAKIVQVADRDLTGVKMGGSQISMLSMEFVWDGDPSAPHAPAKGVLSLNSPGFGFNFAFKVPTSFSKLSPVQPDNYAINVMQGLDGPGQYLKDITCGGRSVLHGRAGLGAGVSCGDLRFLVADDGATLAVAVEDENANPIPDAWVAIIPETAATESEMAASMRIGQADASGAFTAASLPPGKYRVLVTNEMIDMAANRVDRLWAVRGRGKLVEIAPHGAAQLKLAPQGLQ